ncbi:MAG: hypothetical protein BWY15_00774 [Firmicutes bacterium ADurb.Bin193]|nr:MAG: hypothetical protein BWY15_00774 [Firmicutes bacterium ADurb.Bin193]
MLLTYEQQYRRDIGFTNKTECKKFFKGKSDDVYINWEHISFLNSRLRDIFVRINNILDENVRIIDIEEFLAQGIDRNYEIIRNENIIARFNNHGRPREEVYFSWMRGYLACNIFKRYIARIFNIDEYLLLDIGNDNLNNIAQFARTSTADIQFENEEGIINLEIQSGFTGVNDIKKHKFEEAIRKFSEEQIISYVIHFDVFNGKVSVINISRANINNINFVPRSTMEGQLIMEIPDEYFRYRLNENPTNDRIVVL